MHDINYKEALACLNSGVAILKSIRDKTGLITDFTWIYSNEAAEKIYGTNLEQLKKTTLLKVNPSLESRFSMFRDIVEKDLPMAEEIFNPLWGKWLLVQSKKYGDGYIAILEDITERKQVEDQLKFNQKLFLALFENSGVGIGFVDNTGGVINVNNKMCDMLGYSKEELKTMKLRQIYPPKVEDNGWNEYLRLLNGEITFYEIEKQYYRKDGSMFWGLLTVSLFEANEDNTTVIGFVQDIDKRKKAETNIKELNKELLDIDKYKDQVLSIVAHDLRGPLSSCINFFDYLFDEFESLSKTELLDLLKKLHRKLTNINDLLAELLLWGQNQLHKIPFKPVPIVLEEEIEKIMGRYKDLTEEKQIHITTQLSGQKVALADINMFNAIMRNLLSNAIKFSPENTGIIIQTKRRNSDVLISIIDQGVGMDSETINKIKVSNAAYASFGTKGEKGVGLGLSLCKGFIKKNHGRLYINSELNAGSTFSFTLPSV